MKKLILVVMAFAGLWAIGCDESDAGFDTEGYELGTTDKSEACTSEGCLSLQRLSSPTLKALERGQSKRLLVVLEKSRLGSRGTAKLALKRSGVSSALKLQRSFEQLGIVEIEATDISALKQLASDPLVKQVSEDMRVELYEEPGLELIQQPAVAAIGAKGEGTTVVVMDSGLDYTRSAFGTCPEPGATGCSVVYAADFAPEDGAMDTGSYHGTQVAGVVLSVAPAAKIIALDVFDGESAYFADILAALDWVAAHQAEFNIVAVNMSFGGGVFTAPCGEYVVEDALQTLRQKGVLPVAAAGNDGFVNAMGIPACSPSALSVGAVYSQSFTGSVYYSTCTDTNAVSDQVTCFSNAASFLDILAPGAWVSAAGITMSGTSQASPHVAGAAAVLASEYPAAGPEGIEGLLLESGSEVVDSRNDLHFPRLDLLGAYQAGQETCVYALSSQTLEVDSGGGLVALTISTSEGCDWLIEGLPSWLASSQVRGEGGIEIQLEVSPNAGAPRQAAFFAAGIEVILSQEASPESYGLQVGLVEGLVVSNPSVTLELGLEDSWFDQGVELCASEGSSSCRQIGDDVFFFELEDFDGVHYLDIWVQTLNGELIGESHVEVTLDRQPPLEGTVSVEALESGLALVMEGFSDETTAVDHYLVAYGFRQVPEQCESAASVATTSNSLVLEGLVWDTTYGVRVCAVDSAGNITPGMGVLERTK